MANTAFKTQYRNETIDAFEFAGNRLAASTVQEVERNGNEAVFLVAGSGGATASTRNVHGRIPGRSDDLQQNTCTLVEWHDKVERTRFNIFASQGNARSIMQRTTVETVNRKRDQIIIDQLATATITTGSAATASLALVTKARARLGNAKVPVQNEDDMFFVVTPSFEAYLIQIPQYSSADYVDVKPFAGPIMQYRRWAGFNWICHPELPGVGTNNETCFAYHRNAIGHAFDSESLNVDIDYNSEHDYSWARASGFMGAKLLQNSGVVKVPHDGSAHAG